MDAEVGEARRKKTTGLPGYRFIFITGIIVTTGLPLILLLMPSLLGYLNGKLYDEFLKRAKPGLVSDRILIVDVDETSLHEHGQWPWPRYKIAAIVKKLNEAGAAAIGLDIMFPEKDRTSLSIIQEDLKHDLNLSVDFHPSGISPDNDRMLADAISKGPVILGYQFLFEKPVSRGDCRLHPLHLTGTHDFEQTGQRGIRATHVACNLNLLSEEATHSGFFNVSPDMDGILRRVPLIMEYKNRAYPSLALASVMKALNFERIGLTRRFDDYILLLGRTAVPLNSHGSLLVKYRGKGKIYRYVSAADLLAGRIAEAAVKDKIVFVGTSAAGLKELRSTPTDPLFPGVEVHATVADNLISSDFLSRPTWVPGIEFIAAVFYGIFYVFATVKAGAMRSLMLFSTQAAGLVFASFHLFDVKNIYISPVLPLLVLAADFALLNLLRFRREEMISRQQAHDLAQAQAAIIESMASLTETRDPETGEHIKRTQEYIRLLAEALKNHPAYGSQLSDEVIDLIYKSAPLHDIGKVGVSDHILLKPGKLSAEEFEEIKKHATIGRDVIAAIQAKLGDRSFLKIAYEIIYTHHEKWDGSGYPQGLKGEQIPLSGRLMAIVDMYDALTSRRAYKEALSHEEAVRIMTHHAAESFDPQIFRVFLEICGEFRKVAHKMPDTPVASSAGAVSSFSPLKYDKTQVG